MVRVELGGVVVRVELGGVGRLVFFIGCLWLCGCLCLLGICRR